MVFLLWLCCTVMAGVAGAHCCSSVRVQALVAAPIGEGGSGDGLGNKKPRRGGVFYCLTASSDFDDLDLGLLRSVTEFGDLVERQVAIDIGSHAVDVLRVFHVLLDGR